jgi:DNA-binding NarL/FixJ family response regulator
VIRVVIADDHAIVRSGIRLLLSTSPDFRVVGEAADGHATLRALEETPCDVLILDLSLPRLNGVEVLRRVRAEQPTVRVLVLSMYSEDQYALRLVRDGASGYLSKDRSEDELLDAVRRVARGETYVSPRVAEQALRGEDAGGVAKLSGREMQIFLLVAGGATVSDIAAELDLHASTVSSFLARIRTKLGVRTVGELVAYAHRAGLID